MYIKNILILNSGSIQEINLEFQFNEQGQPKPIVLLGQNGTGKTNFLSLITDALIEFAAIPFIDITPQLSSGRRSYFRILGSKTLRLGAQFELCALMFVRDDENFHYISKSGDLDQEKIIKKMPWWRHDYTWTNERRTKIAHGNSESIRSIFSQGCYAFFPSNRGETPYWSVTNNERNRSEFDDKYTDYLGKPIVVTSVLSELQPWLIDVIFDHLVAPEAILLSREQQVEVLERAASQTEPLKNFNILLKTILCSTDAILSRTGRGAGSRKLQVYAGEKPLLPSLNSLSAGQASLLGVFSTILRYADTGGTASPTNAMSGIVLVDEIDSHLHVDLQYRILPQLIKLFPKVQFIFTAHSPMFPLGLENEFGNENIQFIEMPSGRNTSAERFSEFLTSFENMKDTITFEELVSERVEKKNRPVVICEGESDPIYLKTAARLLGYNTLAQNIDWEWIGITSQGRARGGGKDQLKAAKRLLTTNIFLVKQKTVLLFDFDAGEESSDNGMLFVRSLRYNESNNYCETGVENLLPETVFEDRFYKKKTQKKGADRVEITQLDKAALCAYLCNEKQNVADFRLFDEILGQLNSILIE